MKVILSRKGYDSSYGGGASPIMPNGDLLSIPIPAGEKEKGIPYAKLNYGERNYLSLMQELGMKIPAPAEAHFDPDIFEKALTRPPDWEGAFGQHGAALSHLRNLEVTKGDIFLFFGTFKRTFLSNHQLQFERDYPRHILFGYLVVDKILVPGTDEIPEWLEGHAHVKNQDLYGHLNAIYIGGEFGSFKYHPQLVLTRDGFSKSQWQLPAFFHLDQGTSISRHSAKDMRLLGEQMMLSSRGIGQDFVISGNKKVGDWAERIIYRHQ